MDLKDMLNDGPAEQTTRSTAPEGARERSSHPVAPPPLQTNVSQTPTPSSYGRGSHAPPSASPVRQPYSQVQTPVKTPAHGYAAPQYPFPQHSAHSPASAAQHRPYEPPSASSAFPRPPSHGYQSTPSAGGPNGPLAVQSRSNSSLSPTPPTAHSPYAHRQSPQSARSYGHPPPPHPHPNHQYSYALANAALGPPSLHRQGSGVQDVQAAYHQRAYSGASNGMPTGSPASMLAPYASGAPAYFESPGGYNRPPSQQRHSSEYLGRPREHSESVSPKTKVFPRPPSVDARQSNEQELQSRGASSLASASVRSVSAEAPRHVTHPQPPYAVGQQPQAASDLRPSVASEVSQHPPPPAAIATPGVVATSPGFAPSSSPLPPRPPQQLHEQQQPPPPLQRPDLIHHHSFKMGMNHLVTPTHADPPVVNGSPDAKPGVAGSLPVSHDPSSEAVRPSTQNAQPIQPLQNQQLDGQMHQHSQVDSKFLPPRSDMPHAADQHVESDTRSGLKRAAESDMNEAPPSKQRRMRKYAQRPKWAILSKHNPKFGQQGSNGQSAASDPLPAQRRQVNGGLDGPANSSSMGVSDLPPWKQNPPLDLDLIRARGFLGQWEKTFKWNTPYPDMLIAVQDWLYKQLGELGDVGTDPREGTVEIEAKFGTLMREGERYGLPVMNACVIHPGSNNRLHFESAMSGAEHKYMNDFLNDTIKNSMHDGRVKMKYQHIYETDSFHTLSAAGQKLLPQSIQRRQGTRPLRLRTTRRRNKDGTSAISARIVKIPISNLHILNPGHYYDCRISINLEVNLDRPDIDLDSLVADSDDKAPEVDRVKDRIAYKHLAYSIDLTKVERPNLQPTHELELEVDSAVLREQAGLMSQGAPNAFGDVVAGFLDNATYLMRTRPPPQ